MPTPTKPTAPPPCLASSPDAARRCSERSRPTANLSLRLFTAVAAAAVMLIDSVPFCSCQNFNAADLSRINQACLSCDTQFLSMIGSFQNNFMGTIGVNASTMTPLELGSEHCRRFSQIGSCYVDCLEGLPVSYTTSIKSSYQSFYAQFCDPQCQLSFLPACYIADGVPYTLYRTGCDEDNSKIRSGISTCMDLWFGKQNCAGVCSSGARAASGLKLHLEAICELPSWEYECPTVLTSCIEQTYGPYGSAFFGGGSSLTGLGSTSCWNFDGAFASCLSNSINGSVVFGTAPYDVTYNRPCASHPSVVSYLLQLSKNITYPLCSNPKRDFASICPPAASTTAASTTTVPASTSTAATPTHALSTLAPSTATITSVTTASPAMSTVVASTFAITTAITSIRTTTASPATSTSAASTSASTTVAPSGMVTTTTATRDTGFTVVQSSTIVRTTGATIQIAASTVVASPAESTAQRLSTTTEQTIRSTATPAATTTSNGNLAYQTSTRPVTAALGPASANFSSVATSTKSPTATFTNPAGLTFDSTAFSPEVMAKITQACALCDGNYTNYLNDFQSSFYKGFDEKTADPLTVADFHCSRMSSAMQCYKNCVQGNNIAYVSKKQKELSQFYKQFCDADCRMAFLPHCYLSQRLEYSLYRTGCDEERHQLKPGVLSCIDYWAGIQRCSGICTAGQRALSTMKLMLETTCRIPILADDCGTSVNFCMEETFGAYGTTFILSNDVLASPTSVTCSQFNGAFATCLNEALNGQLTIGSGAVQYRTLYNQPCSQYADAIDYLTALANNISVPLCDDPSPNATAYCEQAMLQATTLARTAATTVRATFAPASRTTVRKTAVPTTTSLPPTPVADATAVGDDDELPTDDIGASPVESSTKRKPTTGASSASTRLPSTQQVQDSAGERLRSSHDLLLLLVVAAATAGAAARLR